MIPTIPKDYMGIRGNLYLILERLPIRELVFVGPQDLESVILEDAAKGGLTERITFINENDILDFGAVKKAYEKRKEELTGKYGERESSSQGWYFQQFLKMIFCERCPDDYGNKTV